MGFFKTFNKALVDTAPEKIEALLSRGVENVYPSKEFLRERLLKGERLTLYLGIDPTAPTLHVGHSIVLLKLKEFQDLGHRVILLIGDFTGMIGDPTDKSATRKSLTRVEVLKNSAIYKKQAGAVLSFKGKNPAILKYNSVWLSKMNFENVLDLASHMTVDQMLKRDMFEKRMTEGKPIYIHEFLYPLLQGYDSIALNVDGEIGGNDQTFNMLAGRTLLKQVKNKEKFVLTMKLLTDSSGKKMGKTEGNMASLSDSPEEMYGKVMSWSDGMILPGFELVTAVSQKEIVEIQNAIKVGENPKNLKMRLAREIVSIYHGKVRAEKAEVNFKKTFEEGSAPEELKEVFVSKGEDMGEILKATGAVSSMSAWRRLVEEGAVEEIGGEKISDPKVKVQKDGVFKIGKRRFIKVVVK